jgi:hypothetical protein
MREVKTGAFDCNDGLGHPHQAAGGDAAREKVVEKTKLLDGSGVPKLLRLLGEEIFECVHDLQRETRIGDHSSMIVRL